MVRFINFNNRGKVILERFYYVDIFQDGEEDRGGVISFQYRKKKKEVVEKYYWKLKSKQIQAVLDIIWE